MKIRLAILEALYMERRRAATGSVFEILVADSQETRVNTEWFT
jgi:hypothetical protein